MHIGIYQYILVYEYISVYIIHIYQYISTRGLAFLKNGNDNISLSSKIGTYLSVYISIYQYIPDYIGIYIGICI